MQVSHGASVEWLGAEARKKVQVQGEDLCAKQESVQKIPGVRIFI
jgi:hypothetical protein